eukprot:2694124-Pyramimonas_sp.AAC.1
MPVPCCAAEPLLEVKISNFSGHHPSRRCPCPRVGQHPLVALLVNGPIDLRLQVPKCEVLVGRCGDTPAPEGRVLAMPGVIHRRLDRECKRLFVDEEADAP